MYDLLLRGGSLFGIGVSDLAVRAGQIAGIGVLPADCAAVSHDVSGMLIIPPFVDSHTHLDKALMYAQEEASDLMEAVSISGKLQSAIPQDELTGNIIARMRTVLDWELAAGATTVKTHVQIGGSYGFTSLDAAIEIRREYAGRLELLITADWSPAYSEAFDKHARQGDIHFIGGYPSIMPDSRKTVDLLFDAALRCGLPLDLHVDESDAPNIDCFVYILEKTISCGMEERVTCSHVTALAAVSDSEASRAIDLCAHAGVHIITLPGCNMYLSGRADSQPIRRGITRVDDLLKAGINVSYASDNIRDPFRPFGNGDMLEEALFSAQVMQYGSMSGLETVMRMGTENPARASLLKNYGLKIGCRADMVIIDAATAGEAIIGRANRRLVLNAGKPVAKNGAVLPWQI